MVAIDLMIFAGPVTFFSLMEYLMGILNKLFYGKDTTVWRETLVPLKFGEIDEQPKIHQIFTILIFTQLWLKSHVNNE